MLTLKANVLLVHGNRLTQHGTQLLKLTLVQRRERWKQFQKRITARARLQFNWLLSERGFRGKLTVDHKRRLMDIDVIFKSVPIQHRTLLNLAIGPTG